MLPLPRFRLHQPATLAEALAAVADGAVPIAGGTDLLPSMKHRLFEPRDVVALGGIAALQSIGEDVDHGARRLVIGAGVTLREVARHPVVGATFPALADACRTVATPTIQAMATLGGQIALDTRCVYYNQPAGWRHSVQGCLKKDGTVCHVAPTGQGCHAVQSADTVPALWLYQAQIRIAARSSGGPGGAGSVAEREVPLSALYGDDGRTWLGVRPGELITAIVLPTPMSSVAHRKVRWRGAIDYGTLLVAVSGPAAGSEAAWHAVISAVAPRPIAVQAPTAAALVEAAHDAVRPLPTHLQPVPWRRAQVRVEVQRAISTLAGSVSAS